MPRRLVAAPPSFHQIFLLVGMLVPLVALHAQIGANAGVSQGLPHGGLPHGGNDEEGPFRDNPELRDRLQKGRAADRQRRMVDDANQLVALTALYRRQVDAHSTNTADDQRLLAQIEKLARDLKDRMRGM